MGVIKRYIGLLLLLIAPFVIYELVDGAVANIVATGN
jgi:hypothetical protein